MDATNTADEYGLLPIGPNDHPDPHSMVWSDTELRAIRRYAEMCVGAERERWDATIGAVMPPDFKQWRDSPAERPDTAAWCIANAREQRDQAWEQLAAERERCANVVRYWLAGYPPEPGSYAERCVNHILDGRPAPEGPNASIHAT